MLYTYIGSRLIPVTMSSFLRFLSFFWGLFICWVSSTLNSLINSTMESSIGVFDLDCFRGWITVERLFIML